MTGEHGEFQNLGLTGRAVAAGAVRPALIVYVALGAAALVSWTALASMAIGVAQVAPVSYLGPGAGLLDLLPETALPDALRAFVAICLQPGEGSGGLIGEFSVLAAMWLLMAVATMLPTAAPMIRTYCEIADTAAIKSERVVHPLLLAAGYLAVWVAAALAFAVLSLLFQRAGGISGTFGPATGLAGAAALLLAGAYQFSSLKQACLEKCRNPFTILFARWSTKASAIFRLGVEQGIWCLGCCWALMLVMFAVGLMNLFWMAVIGLFALVEKGRSDRIFTCASGAILLVWGAALLVVSV